MSSAVTSSRSLGRLTVASTHGVIALSATLAYLAFHAVRGFPTLQDSIGDNDSLLRLVQVRDLLAGQFWFDPTQYRMGLEAGFEMHWSRLVDLPIAALILTTRETGALVIWPLLLFGSSLFLIIRAAHLVGGGEAVLPAAVTGGLALYFVNVFSPGALDHHNAQLVLALGTMYALMVGLQNTARPPTRAGSVAGICAALMVAIGMEAAPYAAAACVVAAGCFLAGGEQKTNLARWFGVAFAITAALSLAATVSPQKWLLVACDALSFPQAALAVLGGAGLAMLTLVPGLGRSAGARMAVLAGLGFVVGVVALSAFPECLGDPYADLDPLLRRYWLGSVTEAQSLAALTQARGYGTIAGYYATPAIAVLVLIGLGLRREVISPLLVVGGFLGVAVAVSCWQVRGGVFSVAIASVVLAAWIGRLRARAQGTACLSDQLSMAAGWMLSVSLLWQVAGHSVEPANATVAGELHARSEKQFWCYALTDMSGLAQLSAGTVLTISNLGSIVLHETGHRVLNGPYHRNNDGNRAALELLMAPPAVGAASARALGIDYVAFCPGNPETQALAQWAPAGLMKALLHGEIPDWLQRVEGSETSPLQIFRVSP